MAELISHDQLFKVLITTFLHEFLQLFVPELASEIDPESIEFLDKETFSDEVSGDVMEADIVAKCKFRGADKYFLIHQENQGKSVFEFPRRMFKYFARFFEKTGLDIYPIALFTFDAPLRQEPDSLKISFPGLDVMTFNFRVIQLNRLNWRDFMQKPNPVAAALISKMKIEPKDRPFVKLECLRLLATLKLNPAKSRLIFSFVHAYLKLTAEENVILTKEIETLEPEVKEEMIELTNEWIEEGERLGIEKGERLGIEKGTHSLLLMQGGKRFGTPSVEIVNFINSTHDRKKLEHWCIRIFDVKTWQELLEN